MIELLASLVAIAAVLGAATDARAEQPWTLENKVRHMSIGDSFDGRPGSFPHERNGVAQNGPHPANLGHRVIAPAFTEAPRP